MDAGVPVEAAVEDRVQDAGRQEVVRPRDDVVELVRVFALDMAEGDAGEGRGLAKTQAHGARLSR